VCVRWWRSAPYLVRVFQLCVLSVLQSVRALESSNRERTGAERALVQLLVRGAAGRRLVTWRCRCQRLPVSRFVPAQRPVGRGHLFAPRELVPIGHIRRRSGGARHPRGVGRVTVAETAREHDKA
jgi:hypothetical protein